MNTVDTVDLEVLDRVEAGGGAVVEIVQFPLLGGSADVRTARNLYYANQSGMHLKMSRKPDTAADHRTCRTWGSTHIGSWLRRIRSC